MEHYYIKINLNYDLEDEKELRKVYDIKNEQGFNCKVIEYNMDKLLHFLRDNEIDADTDEEVDPRVVIAYLLETLFNSDRANQFLQKIRDDEKKYSNTNQYHDTHSRKNHSKSSKKRNRNHGR